MLRSIAHPKFDYLAKFRENNKILEEIQQALVSFLEKRRQEFPRFYFLSDEELLLILAQSGANVECVQPHLGKLFENLYRLVLGEGLRSEDFVSFRSSEGEEIKMTKGVKPRDGVEKWLGVIESEMQRNVNRIIREAYKEQDEESFVRINWVLQHPTQAICTASSIQWCRMTDLNLRDEDSVAESLAWWYDENVHMLEGLTTLVRKELPYIQ